MRGLRRTHSHRFFGGMGLLGLLLASGCSTTSVPEPDFPPPLQTSDPTCVTPASPDSSPRKIVPLGVVSPTGLSEKPASDARKNLPANDPGPITVTILEPLPVPVDPETK